MLFAACLFWMWLLFQEGKRCGVYSTSNLFLIYVLCTMICKAFHAFLELLKYSRKKKRERKVMAWDESQYTGKRVFVMQERMRECVCVQIHLGKWIKWLCNFYPHTKANSTSIITSGKDETGEKGGATGLCKWGSTQIQSMDRTRHRIFCKWLN